MIDNQINKVSNLDFYGNQNNVQYANENIETDGKQGLSRSEISSYLQKTYQIDPDIADHIANWALDKFEGEINDGDELAAALGLDTLDFSLNEKIQDLFAGIFGATETSTGFEISDDSKTIDLLVKAFDILENIEYNPNLPFLADQQEQYANLILNGIGETRGSYESGGKPEGNNEGPTTAPVDNPIINRPFPPFWRS